MMDPVDFIAAETRLLAVRGVPEIRLYLAEEAHGLWLKTGYDLEDAELEPPYWAFAWAGGVGLARYILDNPHLVAGKTVLDFASGSGLVAIAAAMAGANSVRAVDIDPFAEAAIALNAEANGVAVSVVRGDLIDTEIGEEIVLAGDVYYDPVFSARAISWFRTLAASGRTVLTGDPQRHYRPKYAEAAELTRFLVDVDRAIEETEVMTVSILSIRAVPWRKP